MYDIALCSSNSGVASRCRSYAASSSGAAKSFKFTKFRLPSSESYQGQRNGDIASQIEGLPSNRFDTVYLHHHTPIPPEPASHV